jgi:hypothetical protein
MRNACIVSIALGAAFLCLGSAGCQSYRAVPGPAPAKAAGVENATRDVEAIADEYLRRPRSVRSRRALLLHEA